jgi:hypothetical protein
LFLADEIHALPIPSNVKFRPFSSAEYVGHSSVAAVAVFGVDQAAIVPSLLVPAAIAPNRAESGILQRRSQAFVDDLDLGRVRVVVRTIASLSGNLVDIRTSLAA